MTAGGDLPRPVLQPESTARALAAAPDHEGHERTGGTVHVALHDRTGASAVPPPPAVRDDGRRVAAALERWHAELGGDDVQVTSTALATWRMAADPPPRDPGSTPLALGSPTTAALERELLVPLRRVREVTGPPSATAAWLGGAPFDPGHPGDVASRDAWVRFPVSGLGHERLNR